MAIRAGLLRHKIVFQQDTGTSRDATGGIASSWTHVTTEYLELTNGEAREFEAMRRRYAEATYVLRGRWNAKVATLTPAMRAVDGAVDTTGTPLTGARTFDILGVVDPDGRRKEVQIAVKERDL